MEMKAGLFEKKFIFEGEQNYPPLEEKYFRYSENLQKRTFFQGTPP